jgi:hypothetical protein
MLEMKEKEKKFHNMKFNDHSSSILFGIILCCCKGL